MAYPASEEIKIDAVRTLDRGALRLKDMGLALKAETLSGPTERRKFLDYMALLSGYIDRLAAIAAIPGIGATITDQKPSFAGDAIAEAQAMRAAAITLRDWLFTNLETIDLEGDPDQYGNRAALTFTTAQTAQFRTNVDAFVATVG